MAHSTNKKEPSLPGENPTVDVHNAALMGNVYALSRTTPNYMPSTERELINWIDQYISTMNANRTTFPNVFSGTGVFSGFALVQMRERLAEALASLDKLPGIQRGVTAFKNIILFNRSHDRVPPPRTEVGMVPPTEATMTGMVAMITAQVNLLRQQDGFNEVLARQFGILPTASSSPDPATLDPQASARFTGGEVIVSFRSPGGLRDVDVAEVRCDRGDGRVQLLGTTTYARFTDHHAIPQPPTVWRYFVCYLSRATGNPVGVQSECHVTVQGRVTSSD